MLALILTVVAADRTRLYRLVTIWSCRAVLLVLCLNGLALRRVDVNVLVSDAIGDYFPSGQW